MITKEERESIINEAVERALLKLPETMGTLMASNTSFLRLIKDFYTKYPEFVNHKDIVSSVTTQIEGQAVGQDYEEILKKAVPKIRERIKAVGGLDTQSVSRPNRDLSKLDLMSDQGEL